MDRKELIDALATSTGSSKADADRAISTLIGIIASTFTSNDSNSGLAGSHVTGNSIRAGLGPPGFRGVVIRRFIVDPRAVVIGQSATVTWYVTFPENAPADTELRLNGQHVTTSGSRSFILTQSTNFILSVVMDGVETRLTSVSVRVDPTDCKSTTIDPTIITSLLKSEFDTRFSGSDQFSLRDNKTVVTLGNGTISIFVPVTISVNNWFDADMNITINLSVFQISTSAGSPIKVVASQVSLNVSWSFLENLASLGCTSFVESGMSQIGQAFMANIVNAELLPRIEGGFNDQANQAIAEQETEDTQHRTHVLSSMTLSPDGLKFKICHTL